MLSLWYQLAKGALWCATARDADVVSYLDSDSRVAFEISVNQPPVAPRPYHRVPSANPST
jgi:hypothetical protein